MMPVLGQALGSYGERPPPLPLRAHFARTWFHRLPSLPSAPAVIVPDGAIDLLWIEGTLRVAGPDRQAKIELIPAGSTVIGLRFRPAAAPAWLGVPASDIVNSRQPLEAFWGVEARRLADWLSEARTSEGIARRLEAALSERAARVRVPDSTTPAIFRLISENQSPEDRILAQVRDVTGLTERTLRRRCHDAFGYGPKTLDRILRFQRFLRLAGTAHPIGTAELAAEAGYSDQSHLTRETRQLAGLTPGAIIRQLPH